MKSKNYLIIIFLLLSVLVTGCDLDSSDDQDPVFELNNTIISSDYPINLNLSSELKFGIEGVGYDEFGADPSAWFENAKKRGVSSVSLDPFDIEEGLTIIDSQTLNDMGFVLDSEYPYALENIFEVAKKENIEITLMIEALAHAKSGFLSPSNSIKKRKITPTSVAKFIKELGVIAKTNGIKIKISEEAYDDEFIPLISSSAKSAGIEYVHFFEDLNCNADTVLSEDYGYYFKDLRNNVEDKVQAKRNLVIGSYYGELGFLNIMYGGAQACGKDFGTLTAGGWGFAAKTHQNIALLRSVQFSPSSIFFVVADDAEGNALDGEPEYVSNYDFSNLNKLIDEFGRKESDSKKPIANLVIDVPNFDGDIKDYFDSSLLGSVSAITNSMLAAGFDLSVSKIPIENADLYYVFSPGFVFEEGQDLSNTLLNLKNKPVPVFYQVVGEVSEEFSPNWHSLFVDLGIKDYKAITDETGSFEPIPLTTKSEFPNGEFEFNFAGYSLEVDDPEQVGYYSEAHTLHFIDPKSTNFDILLTGLTATDKSNDFDDNTVLILKKDNVYFVNGGYLHFATVPFLTNLIAKEPVFNKPSYAYVTTGKERSVIFTAYPTDLDLNLPSGSRVTEFDENGEKVTPQSSLQNNNLKGSLEKFHLLIVD